MLAGSIASIAEHYLMFPIDSIKVGPCRHRCRLGAADPSHFRRVQNALQLSRLQSSFDWSEQSSRCISAHAAYFAINEVSKKHFKIERNSEVYFVSTILTGCFATLAHDFILTQWTVLTRQ